MKDELSALRDMVSYTAAATVLLPSLVRPVCGVVQWLSRLGLEPTVQRRGLESDRTTLHHNWRPGEGTSGKPLARNVYR
jgi:hypothetical protein